MKENIPTQLYLKISAAFLHGTTLRSPMIFKDTCCQHRVFKQIFPDTCHPIIGRTETSKNSYGFATVFGCLDDELQEVQNGK